MQDLPFRRAVPAFLGLVPMAAFITALQASPNGQPVPSRSLGGPGQEWEGRAPPIVRTRVPERKPEGDEEMFVEEPIPAEQIPPQPNEEERARIREERCSSRELRMNVAAMVSVDDCSEPVRLTLDDLTITIAGPPHPIEPGPIQAQVTIRRGAGSPFVVRPTPSAWGHSVTVGRFDDSDGRYVVIQGYTNGFHCCVSVEVALPDAPRQDFVRIGLFQVDHEVKMDAPAPTDVDGDGRADFVARDNRLFYEFDGFAGTHPPLPQVWNIRNDQAINVSGAPRYRHLFVGPATTARRACLEPGEADAVRSACATYVASAARLGEFDRAWREVRQSIDPKRGDMWGNPFLSHLHRFLRVHGYFGPVGSNERDDFAHDLGPIGEQGW